MVAVAVLLGVGQIAAIIAGQTLLGQEAPRDVRGAVFGLAGICASAGILFTNAFGGWLYDSVSKGGPFFLLAGVNFAIFLFGVRLSRRTGSVDRVDQEQRRAFRRAQQRGRGADRDRAAGRPTSPRRANAGDRCVRPCPPRRTPAWADPACAARCTARSM